MYLKDRRPVVITHNPWLSFPLDPNPAKRTQLVKATEVIWATARVYLTMRDGHLKPEVYHLGAEPSRLRQIVTSVLPKRRISAKNIDNQSLRYLPYAMAGSYPIDMIRAATSIRSFP